MALIVLLFVVVLIAAAGCFADAVTLAPWVVLAGVAVWLAGRVVTRVALADQREYLRRFRDGLCVHCGYDKRANPDGRCPECGTP